MYPPQNPPPERDLPELPKYPAPIAPFWVAPMPGNSCNRWQGLVLYCLCGAPVGLALGVVAIWMVYAHESGLWSKFFAEQRLNLLWPPPRHFLEEKVPVLVIGGFFAGIPCGALLWLAVGVWSTLKRPMVAAPLCSSLGGCLAMANVSSKFQGRPVQGREIIETTFVVAAVMLLGALFGGLHAVAVRRAILWFEWWQNRSDQPSRSIAAKE